MVLLVAGRRAPVRVARSRPGYEEDTQEPIARILRARPLGLQHTASMGASWPPAGSALGSVVVVVVFGSAFAGQDGHGHRAGITLPGFDSFPDGEDDHDKGRDRVGPG